VYVTGGNSVFALNKTNGHLLWRANLGSQTNISAPSVAGGTVYVAGRGLFALNGNTGRRRWVRHTVGVNVSTPAIADSKVFVNSQDPRFGLWVFDAITRAFLWRREAPEETEATVTVANGVVFDIAGIGELRMFNTSTGAFLGSIVDGDGHRFNSLFGSQPVVLNGTVYIPAGSRIDAFRLPGICCIDTLNSRFGYFWPQSLQSLVQVSSGQLLIIMPSVGDSGSRNQHRVLLRLTFIYGGGWFLPAIVASDLAMLRRTLSRSEFRRTTDVFLRARTDRWARLSQLKELMQLTPVHWNTRE
jgi:PQQ-like domain